MVTAPPKPVTSTADTESAVAAPVWDGDPLVIQFPPGVLTDELLLEIANLNDDLVFETLTEGGLAISFPTGLMSDDRSGRIYAQILSWADTGHVASSSAGFSIGTGVTRSPDTAWISPERMARIVLDPEGITNGAPDLVVEVRSRGQRVNRQLAKMDEWMRAGARLAWLIDPFTDDGVAWIYREGTVGPERQARPATLSGEDVAEGLVVELAKVWRRSSANE